MKISVTQLNSLRQIGDIGAKQAAKNLSLMLGKSTDVSLTEVVSISLEQVADFLGGASLIVSIVNFELCGDITGYITMLMKQADSAQILNILLSQKQPVTRTLSIYEESALQELANISAGGYLVALSELIGCTIVFSPPSIATDMLGAVLEDFLFMPDIISMKKIFRLLEE
jgi:chemotaxis protein CheC